MKIRMQGRTVELIHWIIKSNAHEILDEQGVAHLEERAAICNGLDAQNISYEIEEIDTASYEWIDGMEFDSMEEAQEALKMGETAYKEWLYQNNTELQTAEYLTNLDYRLLLLEWGLI